METLIVLMQGWEKHRGLTVEATKGFNIIKYKRAIVPFRFWKKFCKDEEDKGIFKALRDLAKLKIVFISTTVFIIVSGENVVEAIKKRAVEIREKYGSTPKQGWKILLVSATEKDAKREIKLVKKFFSKKRGCRA